MLSRIDDRIMQEGIRKQAALGDELLTLLVRCLGVSNDLPLINDLFPLLAERAGDLSGFAIAAHQHILGSTVPQFAALIDFGLLPEHILILGKPYSSNRAASYAMSQLGCRVDPAWNFFQREDIPKPDEHQGWFSLHLQDSLEAFISDVLRRGINNVIVVDDGGVLLGAAQRLLKSQAFHDLRVAGVEQTTAGARWLESRFSAEEPTLQFVVDVARSDAKLLYESPHIATSVLNEIRSYLPFITTGKPPRRLTVGVVGFGSVGASIAAKLKEGNSRLSEGSNVLVYDEDYSKRAAAKAFRLEVTSSLAELFARADLIVGCTGTVLPELSDSCFTGTKILASASSWNYEFFHCTKGAELLSSPRPAVADGPHAPFDWLHSIATRQYPTGIVHVLNSGFPVNFTGGVDPIEPNVIGLTRGLMLAGICQAARELRDGNLSSAKGLVALDAGLQQAVMDVWND